MSRSLLLIICDFLLLSLLALVRFDADPIQTPTRETAAPSESQETAEEDIAKVLKLSLEAEQRAQAKLRQALSQEQKALEAARTEIDALADERQGLLKSQEALTTERATLERTLTQVQTELAATEQQTFTLQQNLVQQRSMASEAHRQIEALENKLSRRDAALEEAAFQVRKLEAEQQLADTEKALLETALEVTEAEKRIIGAQLSDAQTAVERAREERVVLHEQTSLLAEGVARLAENSDALSRTQPLSINALFQKFQDNRILLVFEATEKLPFGTTKQRTYTLPTVLVTDGNHTYILFHTDDSPFSLRGSVDRLLNVTGHLLAASGDPLPLPEIAFAADPRVGLIPVPLSLEQNLTEAPFMLAADPAQSPQAVLINGDTNEYGESDFSIQPEHPGYFKLQSTRFERLMGEYKPLRGDLLLTPTGDFFGLMLNHRYAMGAIHALAGYSPSITLGSAFDPARSTEVMRSLKTRLRQIDFPLR